MSRSCRLPRRPGWIGKEEAREYSGARLDLESHILLHVSLPDDKHVVRGSECTYTWRSKVSSLILVPAAFGRGSVGTCDSCFCNLDVYSNKSWSRSCPVASGPCLVLLVWEFAFKIKADFNREMEKKHTYPIFLVEALRWKLLRPCLQFHPLLCHGMRVCVWCMSGFDFVCVCRG